MNRRNLLKNTGYVAGALTLSPALMAIWQSCENQSRLTYTPQLLSSEQAQFLAALVDLILPQTEYPGGLDVKVDMFMDSVYAQIYPKEGQTKVLNQLDELAQVSVDLFQKPFHKLNLEQKSQLVGEWEKEGAKYLKTVWGKPVGKQEEISFYRQLKSQILGAYFSSEEIGKNYLSYDPIPGVYQGCIDLSTVGNAWTF